jgi:glycosyltransferase involved in cell wall biosynthesis
VRSGEIAIVTHVNPFSSGSGQIQRVFNSLLAIAKDWDKISVYTLHPEQSNPGKLQEVININTSVKVVYLKLPALLPVLKPVFYLLPYLGFGKSSNWILPFIFRQLDKKVFRNCDLVLFEYWHLYKLARKIRSKKTKVICDTHNILLGSFKEFISGKKSLPGFYKTYLVNSYRRLEFKKALGPSFDALIAINKEEEAIYKNQLPGKEILYCPMGVKLPPFAFLKTVNQSKKTFTIVYYGGLSNPRNTNAALEVYNSITGSHAFETQTWNYKVIGSGPPKVLSDLAIQDPSVQVLGFVEDLGAALSDADLAVIPFEGKYGFRSRLIELMHYGVPVLTTRDAIWGMGFIEGTHLFIYENGENLGEKIMQLLSDPAKRNRVALNAKSFIETEFTFEATYLKLSRELKKMIA